MMMRMPLDLINGRNFAAAAFEVLEVSDEEIGNANGLDKTGFFEIDERVPGQVTLLLVVGMTGLKTRNTRPMD